MDNPEREAVKEIAVRLFDSMPGAGRVDVGWRDTDASARERSMPGNWLFCLAIAEEMVKLSGRVFVSQD